MIISLVALLNTSIQNEIRRIVAKLNIEYQIGVIASVLPQHVSLKMPFRTDEIEKVENYFDYLCNKSQTFDIDFSGIDLVKTESKKNTSGIIWYTVKENSYLRSIHEKINSDLLTIANISNDKFDGKQYQFHSSIVIGNLDYSMYKEIYSRIQNELPEITTTIKSYAMFCCHETEIRPGAFYTYKIGNLTIAST